MNPYTALVAALRVYRDSRKGEDRARALAALREALQAAERANR